jgi:threonine dehydrogenase-like Zn-dependent dehydrogenase
MATRVGCRGRCWIGRCPNRQRCAVHLPSSAVLTRGVRVALGAHVIACASPSKLDVARTMGGADFVVDYTQGGWQKEVLKITGGRGVDVVYDPVGRIKGAVPFALATGGYLIMV